MKTTVPRASLRVAADIGGTFTDIAHIDANGAITTRKVLSTPGDYAEGVLRGVGEMGSRPGVRSRPTAICCMPAPSPPTRSSSCAARRRRW